MKEDIINYVRSVFVELVDIHGFQIKKELNDEQYYMIEYCSKVFVLKIEKYFREFYPILYKVEKPDSEISLFNLLAYLLKDEICVPQADFFRKEQNLDVNYRKQLAHISYIFINNLHLINDFFENNYELGLVEFAKFWKNKHPEFYNKVGN